MIILGGGGKHSSQHSDLPVLCAQCCMKLVHIIICLTFCETNLLTGSQAGMGKVCLQFQREVSNSHGGNILPEQIQDSCLEVAIDTHIVGDCLPCG